jgi:6-phosphogluconolactonase
MERWTGDRSSLDRRAAERIAGALGAVTRDRNAILALVGGRSVGGIHAALAKLPVDWPRVHVFLADERLVPIDSDESNYKGIHADLIEPLVAAGKLPPGNAHPLLVDDTRPDRGIGAYDDAFRAVGGRLDVTVLSAGEDGHTASLFPGHPSVRDPGEGFLLVANAPKPPPDRMSASRRLLAKASLGVIVFYGEGKRDALARFDDPSLGVVDCPSKVVGEMHAAVVLSDLGPAPAKPA